MIENSSVNNYSLFNDWKSFTTVGNASLTGHPAEYYLDGQFDINVLRNRVNFIGVVKFAGNQCQRCFGLNYQGFELKGRVRLPEDFILEGTITIQNNNFVCSNIPVIFYVIHTIREGGLPSCADLITSAERIQIIRENSINNRLNIMSGMNDTAEETIEVIESGNIHIDNIALSDSFKREEVNSPPSISLTYPRKEPRFGVVKTSRGWQASLFNSSNQCTLPYFAVPKKK